MSFYENHTFITKKSPLMIHRAVSHIVTLPPLHWHENIEFIYCIDGEGTATIDTKSYDVKKESLTIINSQRPHKFISQTETTYYCLIISAEFLKESGINLDRYEFQETIYDKTAFKHVDKIINEFYKEENCCEVELRALLLSLMAYLYRFYLKPAHKKELDNSVKNAIKFIQKHYMEKITLDVVADAVGFSKFYFARLFKEETKITINDYIRQVRCTEAKNLLETTDIKISDIATECGFENIPYFTTVFKKETGITPSKVRKNKII